jgi:uncharacterized cupin superfamily protein
MFVLGMRRVNLLRMDPDDWTHGQMRTGYRWRASSVGRLLGATHLGATLYDLGEDEKTWPYHFHYGMEEWLVVVDGTPVLRHEGAERELRAGDVVCFKPGPQGAHQVRGPATVLILSANRSPEVIEYLDSEKIGVRPPGSNFRTADAIEYWEGEEEEAATP